MGCRPDDSTADNTHTAPVELLDTTTRTLCATTRSVSYPEAVSDLPHGSNITDIGLPSTAMNPGHRCRRLGPSPRRHGPDSTPQSCPTIDADPSHGVSTCPREPRATALMSPENSPRQPLFPAGNGADFSAYSAAKPTPGSRGFVDNTTLESVARARPSAAVRSIVHHDLDVPRTQRAERHHTVIGV